MFKTLVRTPINNRGNNPAIFLLHGYGSNEEDLFSFSNYLPKNYFIISIRAPFALDFGGYSWYDIYLDFANNKISDDKQALHSTKQIIEFIDIEIDKYQLDKTNINLLGFSQGAILSYALAINYPQKFRKIIALSGYINESIINNNFSKNKNLEFFVSHGIYDEVIPIQLARKTPEYLDNMNLKYKYKEYEMGHEVNQECLNDFLEFFNL